jgi:hypothetical protein
MMTQEQPEISQVPVEQQQQQVQISAEYVTISKEAQELAELEAEQIEKTGSHPGRAAPFMAELRKLFGRSHRL